MAEIELGILGRQCLDRRIDNAETLTREVAAWEAQCNNAKAKVNWQFNTDDARIRLKKLYPSFGAQRTTGSPATSYSGISAYPSACLIRDGVWPA